MQKKTNFSNIVCPKCISFILSYINLFLFGNVTKIEETPNREKPTANKTMALNINSIDIKIDIKLFLDKAPKRPMLKINIATINIENIFILNDSSITLMLLKG